MKILRILLAAPIICIVVLSTGIQFSACKKTVTVHDTVYDISDGLVAYYNFNGGNLNDSSGNANNIVFNNATPTKDRFGIANNAFLFDGSNSYMRVPNSAMLSPSSITLMAIVKFNNFNHGTCSISQIMMKGSQDQDQGVYGIRVTPGDGTCTSTLDTSVEKIIGFYGDQYSSASVLDMNYLVKAGQWVTMVYTYDGHTTKIYVNGQLNFSKTIAAQFSPNAFDLFIGMTQNPSFPYQFNGAIDEIRIYNRALPAGAIHQLQKLTD
jgi:Concanavalin A-like lectin/glucanases superfamily